MTKKLAALKGSCLCGDVSYELTGTAGAFHQCHCSRCRKSTGSGNSANIFCEVDNIRWLSGEDSITRFDLPQAKYFSRHFCSQCGSAVPCIGDNEKTLVIPAGSLDSELTFGPDDRIFYSARAKWIDSGLEAPEFDTYPTS